MTCEIGGGKLHCGTLSSVGGRMQIQVTSLRRYVIGSASSSPTGPCRILPWTSKLTRKLVKSGLGGEVYALSEMVGHTSLLRYFSAPFEDLDPGPVGSEDCESLFNCPKTKNLISEKYLVSHLHIIQQALEQGELGDVYWLPGTGNPANGLAKERSDVVPHLRTLASGRP